MERVLVVSAAETNYGSYWHVTDNDPKVAELFGTNTIPTPYKTSMDIDEVISLLAKLNPQATVRSN